MNDRCIAKVWTGYQYGRCRNGGHGEGGLYCKQHDPSAKSARQAVLDEKREKETDRARRNARFQADCIKYVRSIAAGRTDDNGDEARRIIAALEVHP